MSRFIPSTINQQKEMLGDIGLSNIEELFNPIPEKVRLKTKLNLAKPLSEMALLNHMKSLSSKNISISDYSCFLGAGAYDHFIPSIVGHVLSRQEFYTAYTPYQPEISQGTLQAIFEYQTMMCELTGLDVSNASMYDGATAMAEAASMALNITGRDEIIVSSTVNPQYRKVLETYSRFNESKVIEFGFKDGKANLEELNSLVSEKTAAVIIQNPNFFGIIEDVKEACNIAHKKNSLFIASVNPISLGLLKSPGSMGADIVVGDGQPLGNPLSFGGPSFGFLTAKLEYLRKMPGRIVGETLDKNGKRAFVLTVQTREQHIRRERATSNICSNQALNALAATVYLSTLGKQGFREIANLCFQKSHFAYNRLIETGAFEPVFSAPFFNEFLLKSTIPVKELNDKLIKEKIIGGLQIEKYYPDIENGWLIAVTEKRSKEDIDNLVRKAVD